MPTLRFLIQLGKRYLTSHDISSPLVSSEQLLLVVCGKEKRSDLYLADTGALPKDKVTRFIALIRKRATGYPLQYLVGKTDFLESSVEVNEHVLIPRPETECVVTKTCEHVAGKDIRTILDIGTGSGVIAISMARAFPLAKVVAVDISEEALALARHNAELNQVAERIFFVHGNVSEVLADDQVFDLVVSNPPYISTADMQCLPDDVRYEPSIALHAGTDGLDMYRTIVAMIGKHMHPDSVIAFEIGLGQENAVCALLQTHGFVYSKVENDDAGIVRIVLAEKGISV